MKLLSCEKLSLSYDGKPVLSDLSFSVSNGDYLCIVGENGAGKSTLMKGILGLLKPTAGEIIFSGGLKQNEIGYLPQQSGIQKDFPASCYEVVVSGTLNKSGFLPFYKKMQKETALQNMDLLGITSLKNKCYQDLSGGQQQRVLLARALCAADKLIVLDEPVSGLDPMVTRELYDLIKFLNKERHITVIMVSHDIVGAIAYATHILHLEHENTFYGTVHDYVNSDFAKKFISSSGRREKQ